MKPQQKKQQQQLREKGFDTFISGANKDRVNQKNKNQLNLKTKSIKKWNDEKSQSQKIGTLDHDDLEVLRKSLVQGNVLSKSQQDLLEKLQKDTPIDHRYDPHFSQLLDSDNDELDEQQIQEEEELCQSEGEENDQNVYKDDFEKTKPQIQPIVQQQQPQQVIQVVNLPATKPRPISAISEQPQIQQQQPQQFKQPSTEIKPTPLAKPEIKQYASKPQLRANSVTKQEDIKNDNHSFNPPQTSQSQKPQEKKDNLEELFEKIEKLSSNEKQKLILFLNRNTIDLEEKTDRSEIQNEQNQQKFKLDMAIKQQKQQKEIQIIENKPKEQVSLITPQQITNNQPSLQIPQIENKKRNASINNVIQMQQEFVNQEKAQINTEKNSDLLIDKNCQLKIRILSTWGNPSLVGLTEIELYTTDGNKVQLKPYNIKMTNAQSLKMPEILINGKYLTKDAVNMWLGSMPDPPKTIDIEISYDDDIVLGGIKIFNYNKSLIDSVKGVRDMEVLCRQNGKVISKIVEIKKGTGFEIDDYGTEIQIMDNFKFPTFQNTQSKFAQKLRGQIDQSDIIEKKQEKLEDSKPPPSRKGKGPIVVDVFKGERLDTGKSDKKVEQPQQQNNNQTNQQQIIEPRRRRDIPQPTQDYLEETLQYFNITQQGRLKPVQRQDIIEDPVPLPKYEEIDALDFFFKGQQRPNNIQPKQQLSKWETPTQQQIPQQIIQQPNRNNFRQQTQENAQLIKDLLNQPLINQAPVKKAKKQVSLPTIPQVRIITIHIHSTWGDKYYVGLNGIEIFNEIGKQIEIQDPYSQVKADPSDINVLPEYFNDPRTPDKLVDGVYYTQSDMHVWLSPFQRGKINKITIDLIDKKKISMIRIWNYNKSRIHSFRGAKDISLYFDNQIVFRGDIKKGFGNMNLQRVINQNEQPFELFLFTSDDNIIQQIAKNDWINTQEFQTIQHDYQNERPNTGNADSEVRPTTSAKVTNLQNEIKQARQQEQNQQRQEKQQIQRALINQNSNGITCRYLQIKLLRPWADQPYIGLTGVDIYGKEGKIQVKNIKSDYQSDGDKGNINSLINGINVTTNDMNMYILPYQPGRCVTLTFTFDIPQLITSIRIWNYNKSYEDTFRGAKFISLLSDQGIISNCVGLKRAPGCEIYDYAQTITIPCKDYIFEETTQVQKQLRCEYEINNLMVGYELKIQLITTFGDIHYIGLNGLEILDYKGRQIQGNIGAEPSSVRILQSMRGDKRVVENLLDGINETHNDIHMWLAPFTNRCFDHSQDPQINTLYFGSEQPFALGCIIFWNYTKTPLRGVHEIAISLDDYIIYRGYLRQAGNDGNQTVILFYRDMQLMERFSGKYYTEFGQKQTAGYKNEEKGTRQVQSYALLERPITRVKEALSILLKNQRYFQRQTFLLINNKQCINNQTMNRHCTLNIHQENPKTLTTSLLENQQNGLLILKIIYSIQVINSHIKLNLCCNTIDFIRIYLDFFLEFQQIKLYHFLRKKSITIYQQLLNRKYEYRRIKKMLGIPYDQSNQSTQYEKLKEDIQVLNSLSKFTENSTISILNELFKIQPKDYQLNIDETWLTMQQQELNIPKLNNQQVPQNLQLLKKFVQKHSKDKINLPFHLLKGKTLSNLRNSCNQSPERLFPTQKSTSQQYINSSQEECEFKSQMKSKILTLSQQHKIKTHNKNQIDQNYYINTLGKRNSTHFITSTSSVSPEQIRIEQSRLSQIYLNVQDRQSQSNIFNHAFHFPVQSSNQFTFKNDVSPKKKNQQIIQIYSNNLSNKIKTQPRKSPERQRVFQHTSSQSTKYNNSKTLFQTNDKISSFLQLKFRLDNLQNSNNKRKQLNPNSDINQIQKEEKQYIRGQSYNMVKNKITAKKQIKNK
ncbi:unnamed protein product [Paramecium primaurelia]|uniref:KATNIP domain-containing protein n=1 Tax=Paramecium primaurelia TaxID=5886 RepID=A0A8S1LP17_PARPR|nr:unnamed protein product [Paramecium primaurelia]